MLAWEGAPEARVDLTLLDARAMRRLNARVSGRQRLTDVVAFALPQPEGGLVGDVYICPAAAARWVANGGGGGGGGGGAGGRGGERRSGRAAARLDEELIRLAVHGTLHVLGYDHPVGPGRTRSVMWRRQERYVRRLVGGGG